MSKLALVAKNNKPTIQKRDISPIEKQWTSKWEALSDYIKSWYYLPDMTAIQISLAQYVSHLDSNAKPVWIFVLGGSSAGKTATVIDPITIMPDTHLMGIVNENSFLSAFGNEGGILKRLRNGNGMLLWSDFSTFLNLHPDKKAGLQSQLRDIYDGMLEKQAGNKKKAISWRGKVTILAACTYDLERYWSLGHDLGERFLMYKMPMILRDPDISLQYLTRLKACRSEVIETHKTLIEDMIDIENLETYYDPKDSDIYLKGGFASLAQLVSMVRRTVHWDSYGGRREISSIGSPEISFRLLDSLITLSQGSATLFRRSSIAEEDLNIAREIAIGSMPTWRVRVLAILMECNNNKAKIPELVSHTKIPRSSLLATVKTMEALELVKSVTIGEDKIVQLRRDIKDLVRESRITLDTYKLGLA